MFCDIQNLSGLDLVVVLKHAEVNFLNLLFDFNVLMCSGLVNLGQFTSWKKKHWMRSYCDFFLVRYR